MNPSIIAISAGKAELTYLGDWKVHTGYNKKQLVDGAYVSERGLEGDEQGNLRSHGGRDKALFIMPIENYVKVLQSVDCTFLIPGFGENLTTIGLNEESVHIGDVYQCGQAEIQITMPRKPCMRTRKKYGNILDDRFNHLEVSGFYARCVKSGHISPLDPLIRVERVTDVSVSDVFRAIIGHRTSSGQLGKILALPQLPKDWAQRLRKISLTEGANE